MFNRIFKPKWQHQDFDVRKQAFDSLDDEQDQEIILKIAKEDSEVKLRLTAIARLNDLTSLSEMLSQTKNSDEWLAIANRIIEMDGEKITAISTAFTRESKNWSLESLLHAINQVSDKRLAQSLLETIDDENILSSIAIKSKAIDIKMAAVEKLTNAKLLQDIVKQGTHKQVLQVARAKLKLLKEEASQINETRQTAEKLLASINKLSGQSWDSQYQIRLESIRSKWQLMEQDLISEWFVEYDQAIERCNQTLIEHDELETQLAVEREIEDKQQVLFQQLDKVARELIEENQLTHHAISDAVKMIDENWQQLSNEQEAKNPLKAQYQELKHKILEQFKLWEEFEKKIPEYYSLFESLPEDSIEALDSWNQKWRQLTKQLNWPKTLALPTLLADWKKQAKKVSQQFKAIEIEQKKKAGNLHQKIKVLEKHIRDKNLIAANRLANYIEHKQKGLAAHFNKSVQQNLDRIQTQFNELKDWHAFATTPKKESLCESMEKLIDSELAPLQQAEAVRKIQQEWQALVSSDAKADEALWDKFKRASDLAYAPCLDYYEEQDKKKADNLKHRLSLCEELELRVSQIDWANADFKALDKLQHQSLSNWKKYAPVPQNEHKPAQKRFDKINAILKEHLNAEKQSNLEERKLLVEKATKLLELESVDNAIESAKKLQHQWKELGITFFKADKEQWQAFRASVDALFSKREEEKQAFKTNLKSNEDALVSVTEQIEQLSKLQDAELKQSSEQFETLVKSWDKSKELPRAHAKKLIQGFDAACEKYRVQFAGISSREKRDKMLSLHSCVAELEKAEVALLNNSTPDLDLIKSLIEKSSFDASFKDIVQTRLNNLASTGLAEVNLDGTKRLEMIVLQAEILAELDSPKECKQARMALQLEQLRTEIGVHHSPKNKQEEVLKLFKKWLSEGFVEQSSRESLNMRLASVFEKVGL